MSRSARELLAVAGAMAVITVVVLWPQVMRLDQVPAHTDPLFSIWRLSWIAHQLPSDPAHLFDANIFHPERATLAHSDAMLLTGAAASPLFWLGTPPVVVYNLLLLASFVLSGVTMFALARSLDQPAPAAFVAGIAFAFLPFRIEHYVHLELLSAFWMPLTLMALHRVLGAEVKRRDGVRLGLLLAAQYHSSIYFGVYLATYMVVVGGVLAVARARLRAAAGPLVLAAVVAGALIAPALPPYFHLRESIGDRPAEQVEFFSATPSDYLSRHQPDRIPQEVNERQVYPGVALIVLALIGLWPLNSAVRWAYVAGLALAFELSLGTNGFLHPIFFEWVTPFRGLRVPARFAMVAGLSLAVLAGYGMSLLLARVRGRTARVALAALASVAMLAEAWPSLTLLPLRPLHPVYAWLAEQPPGPIVEVPISYEADPQHLISSISHFRPMVNGSSGSYPRSYRLIQGLMRKFPDAESIVELVSRDVSLVIVHESLMGAGPYRALIDRMDSSPALTLAHTATDGTSEARVYRLRR